MDHSNESDYQLTPEEIEDLLETQRALNAFLTEMSSEVRTPTTVIVSYSDLLLGDETGKISKDQQREIFTNINRSGRYILKVWDDLMVMSQVLVGQLHLDIKPVNVSQVIEEAISAVWDHWHLDYYDDERPVIEKEILDNTPDIWADNLRLQQAITRIVVVSITSLYQKKNGKIVLRCRHDENWVTLTVTTVSEESIYFWGDSPQPRLFMSRAIIEKHGGQLKTLCNEENELTFGVVLPINRNNSLKRDASE